MTVIGRTAEAGKSHEPRRPARPELEVRFTPAHNVRSDRKTSAGEIMIGVALILLARAIEEASAVQSELDEMF